MSLPRIHDTAPDFTAVSTHGELTLSKLEGKWVVLFSHPADFTPVCSTEFAAFARRQDDFEARNVQLLGLSVDSVYSHIAWAREIERLLGVKVRFPVIADLDTKVSQLYGLIHPGASSTATVRGVFILDPKRQVRALLYYPLTTGRSIDEILRVVDALQLNAERGLATPAEWRPGDAAIVPAPLTSQGADERLANGDAARDVRDWWLSFTRA